MRLEQLILGSLVFLSVFLVIVFVKGCQREIEDPCVEYGEPYQTTIFIKSGSVMLPMTSTHKDCIRRESDE